MPTPLPLLLGPPLSPQVSRRAEVDAGVRDAVAMLLARTNALGLLRAKYGSQLAPEQAALLAEAGGAANGASYAGWVELVVGQALPRPEGAAVVDDWACLRVSAPPSTAGSGRDPAAALGQSGGRRCCCSRGEASVPLIWRCMIC